MRKKVANKLAKKLYHFKSVFGSFVFDETESINNEEKSLSGYMPQLSVKVQYIQETWNVLKI